MKIQNIRFLKELTRIVLIILGVIQVTLSGTRYYKLTDVAIHSLTTGEYGMTDLGMPGMVSVLLGHKCTNICHQIGLNHPLTSQNE